MRYSYEFFQPWLAYKFLAHTLSDVSMNIFSKNK